MASQLALVLVALIVVSVSLAQEDDSCRTPPAGWPRRPPQCCTLPFPLDNMKQKFGECIRQIGRPSSAVPTAKAVRDARLCIEECVYKGMGFLSEGSNLERDGIMEQLKSEVSKQPIWSTPLENAMQKCFTDTENTENVEAACSHRPHVFTHCLMRELFLNCPASQWTNSDECNLVKGRMSVCPNIPPPPPPPPQRPPQPPQ